MNSDGLNDLRMLEFDLAAAGPRASAAVGQALRKAGADIEATAKLLAPVDTGALQSSIGVQERQVEGDYEVLVGPTVNYAPHLEHGTARTAPQAFMGPALDRHAPDLVQAVAQAVEGAFGA